MLIVVVVGYCICMLILLCVYGYDELVHYIVRLVFDLVVFACFTAFVIDLWVCFEIVFDVIC